MTRETLACIALASLPAGPAAAQSYTAAECADIASNVASHPSGLDSLAMLLECPEFPATMTGLLDGSAIYGDTAAFDAVVRTAGARQEGAIFSWAAATAADARQSLLRRLTGTWLVAKYLSSSALFINLRALVSYSGSTEGCMLMGGEVSRAGSTGLPASAHTTGHDLAVTLGSVGQPTPMRYLASCLRIITRQDGEGIYFRSTGFDEAAFNPATDFEFGVLCGRRVSVRNKSTQSVSMRLVWGANATELAYNNQARPYSVEPRLPNQAYHEEIWQVPSTSALKFRIQQVITLGNVAPYVTLVDLETLDTSSCS